MKITNRDNGMAKLLFMQHERDIFRVREWVIFHTCQRTLNMTQLQSTRLRLSSLPVISHAGYYCWAPVLQRLMVGTPRFPAPLSTQPRIKCISHIHHSTHHSSNRSTPCYAWKHGWKCSLDNQSSKLFFYTKLLWKTSLGMEICETVFLLPVSYLMWGPGGVVQLLCSSAFPTWKWQVGQFISNLSCAYATVHMVHLRAVKWWPCGVSQGEEHPRRGKQEGHKTWAPEEERGGQRGWHEWGPEQEFGSET